MCVYTSVTFLYSEVMHKFGFWRGIRGIVCATESVCVRVCLPADARCALDGQHFEYIKIGKVTENHQS